jgi:hypothetical protein
MARTGTRVKSLGALFAGKPTPVSKLFAALGLIQTGNP